MPLFVFLMPVSMIFLVGDFSALPEITPGLNQTIMFGLA